MSLKDFEAGSGRPVDDTPPAAPAASIVSFDNFDIDLVAVNPANPRTTVPRAKFDAILDGPQRKQVLDLLIHTSDETRAKLAEILGSDKWAEFVISIHAQGVNQPVLLRPLPAARLADTSTPTRRGAPRPTLEIVAGERRYYGSRLAGLRTLPAMVKDMTDAAALEFALVENLQRDDLHELEEAEGYQRLCDMTGIRKEDIGRKIGKSRSHVYQRLQLLALCPEARQAFRDGKLEASHYTLIAGVPDHKLQLKALAEFTMIRADGRTISVRDAREWLKANVLLRLDAAPFDTKLGDLLAEAGSCQMCPKRTGANRDIFQGLSGPDMCTDPACYAQKAKIHIKLIRDEAADQGMDVIVGTEAKRLKPSAHISEIKGYTRVDAKITVDGGDKAQRVSALLTGKDAPKPILFVDPHTQEKIKVLPTDVVDKLLVDKGMVKPAAAAAKDSLADRKVDKAVAQAKEQHAFAAAWKLRTMKAADAAIRAGAIVGFSAPVLRAMLLLLVESELLYSVGDELQRLWGLPDDSDLEGVVLHVQAAPDDQLGRMTLGVLMATELGVNYGQPTPLLDQIAVEAGVDVAKIKRDLKAEQQAATNAAAAPPGAKDQAALQGPIAKTKGGKAARAKNAGGGRDLITEEEAKSGIADAMQKVDEPAEALLWTPKLLERCRVVTAHKPGVKEIGDIVVVVKVDVRAKSVWTQPEMDSKAELICRSISSLTPAPIPLAHAVGVKVVVNKTATQARVQKFVGKTGAITKQLGAQVWDVTFKGRIGGIASFLTSELDLLA